MRNEPKSLEIDSDWLPQYKRHVINQSEMLSEPKCNPTHQLSRPCTVDLTHLSIIMLFICVTITEEE